MAPLLRWIPPPPPNRGGTVRVELSSPDGTSTSLAYKLDFPCTKNEAKDEAFVIGLASALRMRIGRLQVQRDSKLIKAG